MAETRTLIFLLATLLWASVVNAKDPNIVFILVDDMGYGDLSSYNAESKIPTPNLDNLAHSGMRFTDAHSAGSLCHPSRYGLMTGQLPFRVDYSVWREHALISSDRMTVASFLKGQDYHTAMVGKWHLGFEENGFEEDGYENPLPGGPVDIGFDSFFGIRASTDIPPYFYIDGDRALVAPVDQIEANYSEGWTKIQGAFWRAGGIAPNLQLEDVLPRFTDEAVGVIRDHARSKSEQPLFLYLAYPAPHTPWLPAESFQGISGASTYGDFMAMVDGMIGRVLKALQNAGMEDETLVIFSSDNGPVWYDTDVQRFDHDSSGGMRGMKGDAWEGGHRMPFVVRWPGQVKPGSVSDQTIGFTDVLATFAAVTGTKLPEGQGPDSFSFLPALQGNEVSNTSARGPLVLESARGHFSIRSGKWKYINGVGSGGFSDGFSDAYKAVTPGTDSPTAQLYDMETDPGETRNLFFEKPEVVKTLAEELERIVGSE